MRPIDPTKAEQWRLGNLANCSGVCWVSQPRAPSRNRRCRHVGGLLCLTGVRLGSAAALQVCTRRHVRIVVRVSRPAAGLPSPAHMDQDRPEHQHGESRH